VGVVTAQVIKGDNLDLLVGSVDDPSGLDVDAGMILQWGHKGWSPLIRSSLNQQVIVGFSDDKGPEDFSGGQYVYVTFLTRPSNAVNRRNRTFPSLVQIQNVNGTQQRTLGVLSHYPARPMRMKRLYSIAQRSVQRGYKKTGSFYTGAVFFGGSLIAYSSPLRHSWDGHRTKWMGAR
jgi:hypothetical protein